jgi:hypothetical protein
MDMRLIPDWIAALNDAFLSSGSDISLTGVSSVGLFWEFNSQRVAL